MDRMDGTIAVESIPGHGSTFICSFSADEARSPLPLTSQASTGLALTSPMHILVGEDDKTNGLVISSMLKKLGHECTIVEDGQAVVDEARHHVFDLIFMDVEMPVINGMQATQAIRHLASPSSSTPIVALTAHVLAGQREMFLQSGMNDYLSKPLHLDTLKAMIERHHQAH
jgi:CheY-like chemotaxis protein